MYLEVRESFLDGGGKRSATPLWRGRRPDLVCLHSVRAKAPSPLRSAGAVQDAGARVAGRAWSAATAEPRLGTLRTPNVGASARTLLRFGEWVMGKLIQRLQR